METIKKDGQKLLNVCSKTAYLLFAYFVGFVLTLIMHDGYYDLLKTKASCFAWGMMIVLPLSLAVLIFKALTKKIAVRGLLDHSLLYLFITSLISTVLSSSPGDAFSGRQGFYIGSFAICSLILIYFSFKDDDAGTFKSYLPLIVVCFLEYSLTLTDSMGIDVLGFRTEIARSMKYGFFATIGNCNWFVGYLSLTVPLFICLYVGEENKKKAVGLLMLSVFGLFASYLNGADGIYLAYVFCGLFMIPFLFADLHHLRRTSLLLLSFSIGLFLIRIIPFFSERLNVLNGIGRILNFYPTITVLMIVSVFLYQLSSGIDEKRYRNYQSMIICSLYLAITGLVLFFVIKTVHNYDYDFGNGRLDLWKYSLNVFFRKYTPMMQLFGVGQEVLEGIYERFSDFYGVIFTTSHSEALQTLMTMGISGLLAWSMSWLSLFASFFRKKAYKDRLTMGLYMGLFAYFAQSFVNSATILNLCVLTVYVIMQTHFLNASAAKKRR